MVSPPAWSEDLLGLFLQAVCCSRHSVSSPPYSPWSELPEDILCLVMAGLPNLADRARFRAVCRSWRSVPSPPQLPWIKAVWRSWRSASRPPRRWIDALCRPSHSPPRQLPWIVLPGGFFDRHDKFSPRARGPNPAIPFPEKVRCIGSTDGWLALDCTDDEKRHAYFLLNPFSKALVSLPELDAFIGNVSGLCRIRKVLIRSVPDDLLAVMTNNWNHPVILIRPGKGVWLPRPQATPFIDIIDIVFHGNRLYGITQTEDLISFCISFSGDCIPRVTDFKQHIGGSGADSGVESEADEGESNLDELRTGDYKITDGILCDETPYAHLATYWYFLESCGKLIMVKRQVQWPKCNYVKFTCKLQVFEADLSARTWVPASGGLGDQALFISKRCSKSVSASGEIEKDAIYFIDTGEVFCVKSQTQRQPAERSVDSRWTTCIFPQS